MVKKEALKSYMEYYLQECIDLENGICNDFSLPPAIIPGIARRLAGSGNISYYQALQAIARHCMRISPNAK